MRRNDASFAIANSQAAGVAVEHVFNAVVVACVAVCVWLALKPNYVFRIAINHGSVCVRGKVAGAFVSDVKEVCDRSNVARGWVGGIGRGKGVRLAFSRSIPSACQQQLRNLWAARR